MKQNLITATMLALSLLLTVSSCDKEDDSKPIDSNIPENTDTPENPIVEMVTITLPNGSKIEVEKGSKYKVSEKTTTDNGLTTKYFVNGEDVSGQEISVTTNIEITSKEFLFLYIGDDMVEVEKDTEYALPAGDESEYIIYDWWDKELFPGDKIFVDINNYYLSVGKAVYQNLTFAELQTADFSDKDKLQVYLRITDVTDENVGKIKEYLTKSTWLIIAGDVTNIGEDAFADCGNLTRIVEISNSVKTIGDRAFQNCEDMWSIQIPNSVTSIGEDAFSGCSQLQSIVIPNSVESIGAYAFAGCWSLWSIEIPNSVKSIEEFTFINCTSLESVIIPNSIQSIGRNAFNCCGIKSIVIPNTVESIEEATFASCTKLESIVIPNSVTRIKDYAFDNCWSLESITIKNSKGNVTIGSNAFNGCPETLEVKYEPQSK